MATNTGSRRATSTTTDTNASGSSPNRSSDVDEALDNVQQLDPSDSVVEALNAAVGQAVLDRDESAGAVGADGACEFDERGEPAALRPRTPAVEQHGGVVDGEVAGEDRSKGFLSRNWP